MRTYQNYRSFSSLSIGMFSRDRSALAAPNFKDLPRKPALSARSILVGNYAQEGRLTLACNGLFALEGISFATACPGSPRPTRMQPDSLAGASRACLIGGQIQ
jgi:hypothetical protein